MKHQFAVALLAIICSATVAEAQQFGTCSPPNDVSRRWGSPKQVLFDTGSTKIGAEGQKTITEQAQLAKANYIQQICLTGFTDKQGNAAANEKLAQSRAQAVAAALVKQGVDAKAITITPVSSENTGATIFGRGADSKADRRVDIKFGK